MAAKTMRRHRREEYFVQGNTVRKIQPMPQQERPTVTKRDKKLREKALQMNVGYVLFLTLAAAAMLFFCTQYLQLQSEITNRNTNIASLEGQLNDLTTENDAAYNEILDAVDLSSIKNTAINELGMVYAGKDQIVLYQNKENDYVKQYQDIPKNGEVEGSHK